MSTLSLVPGGASGQVFAPPLRFKPVFGEIRYANCVDTGPFANVTKLSGTVAQKNGKRYERKVQKLLGEQFEGFRPGQWFEFRDKSQRRFCQVDGLLVADGRAIIFEIKYTLVLDAWWQLRKLYEPVVRKAFGLEAVLPVIICKNFDPMVSFPESVRIRTPSSLGLEWEGDSLSIVPWRV